MKLIKTNTAPVSDAPRFKSRHATWKIRLTVWLAAVTIMLVLVLCLLIHLDRVFEQMMKSLAS